MTNQYNNKYTFYLNTLTHNNTINTKTKIKKHIIKKQQKNTTHLILSNKKPTIHPHFIKFIKYNHLTKYHHIQTITNKHMFSYPNFLKHYLNTNLQKITFSIHKHNTKIHDTLINIPKTFNKKIQNLKLALQNNHIIININIYLNKNNIKHLPQLLKNFIKINIQKFNLLHLIPFKST